MVLVHEEIWESASSNGLENPLLTRLVYKRIKLTIIYIYKEKAGAYNYKLLIFFFFILGILYFLATKNKELNINPMLDWREKNNGKKIKKK